MSGTKLGKGTRPLATSARSGAMRCWPLHTAVRRLALTIGLAIAAWSASAAPPAPSLTLDGVVHPLKQAGAGVYVFAPVSSADAGGSDDRLAITLMDEPGMQGHFDEFVGALAQGFTGSGRVVKRQSVAPAQGHGDEVLLVWAGSGSHLGELMFLRATTTPEGFAMAVMRGVTLRNVASAAAVDEWLAAHGPAVERGLLAMMLPTRAALHTADGDHPS